MNIKNFLWIAPFLSFFLGYLIMHQIMYIPETITPHLVGKQIHTVLPIVTQYNLNLRLIDQKEETDLQEGIILNQTPAIGTSIRPGQPIFVVLSKKPALLRAPQCVGLPIHEINQLLQAQNIQPRIYYLSHPYPEKCCFAQSPHYDEPLETNKLILYISSGNNKPIIWPDFTNLPLQEVIDFLSYYDIEPYIINDYMPFSHSEYVVIDQRPFAGTLLTLDENKPLSVQLRIRAKG